MLLAYGVRNFFCFREGADVSFRLPANCPEHISKGLFFTPVLCVKGANGSGKTHLLKGLSFMAYFCTKSFQEKPAEEIGLSPFFDSLDPCEFYAEFAIGEITYRYELEASSSHVVRESIFRTKGKKIKIVERKGDEITYCTKEFGRLRAMNLRSNVSLVATANQYQFGELTDVFTFFDRCVSNVNYGGLRENPFDIALVSEVLSSHAEYLKFVKEFISQCDVGVSDISILHIEGDEGKKKYFPVFHHKIGNKTHPVTAITESSGTKALFKSLLLYRAVLDFGGVLILDEFDINLHPLILPKLVNLFLDPEANPKHGQLIFTTHNTGILNLLGRYRTYLVNKDGNESYAYRLDEVPGDMLRNDRPIAPHYLDGKIGGVPRI